MFTGIIAAVGKVELVRATAGGLRLRISGEPSRALAAGGSIAVEGVCLTAAAVDGDAFEADVSAETAAKTTFGNLRPGDTVNLELPLAVGNPLGGHIVQGHVDGIGIIRRMIAVGEMHELTVSLPAELGRYVVPKGSIAVAGISLTAVSADGAGFMAAVIPHTYEHTTLKTKRPGDAVNVEVDIIAKYVERFTEGRPGGLSPERLAELGY